SSPSAPRRCGTFRRCRCRRARSSAWRSFLSVGCGPLWRKGSRPAGDRQRVGRGHSIPSHRIPSPRRGTFTCAAERGDVMAYEFATYEKKGRIAIVTVNRPERMNALHPPANLELHEIWSDFERDPEVWVGILTGAGDKAFSAGNDLRYTAEHGRDMVRFAESGFGGLANRTTCWKP